MAQTLKEMQAELEALKAENAKLKAQRVARVTLKVSEKGCLSVYGLGRFPVTLYPNQWEKLLSDEMTKTIKDFMVEHKSEMSWEKPPQEKPTQATTPNPS